MSWAKLDDGILDNEKIVSVGPLGFALHIAAICYCARNLTDGRVPFAKVATLLDFSGVQIDCANPIGLPAHGQRSSMAGDTVSVESIVDALVGAGLWLPGAGFYEINDYLEYNPSKAEVLAERERMRAQRSEAGRRSGESRRTKRERETNEATNETRTGSERKTNPVPVPVPVSDLVSLIPQNKKNSLTSQPRESDPTLDRARPKRGGEPAQVRSCLRLAAGAEGEPTRGSGEAKDSFKLDGRGEK